MQDYYSEIISYSTSIHNVYIKNYSSCPIFKKIFRIQQVEQGYAQYVAHTITSVGKILKNHRIGKR